MAYRDSDQLIVLYEIEEGADRIRSLQRKHLPGCWTGGTNANLPAGNSKEGKTE